MVFCRRVLYVMTFILFSKMGKAQNAEPVFKHLQLGDGLSNNIVNCILQDERGFLWFGTEDGLNRYDGKFFEVFANETHDSTGISGNRITALYEDKSRILWIGAADGGLTKYDFRLPASRQFRQFNHSATDPNSLPENGINKITEDGWGNLWIATAGYVVRFNKRREKFDLPLKKTSPATSALWMDDNDTLWIGRADGGFIKINTHTLECAPEKPSQAPITAIFKQSGHDLWYSASKSVFRQTDHISGIPLH